MKPLTYTSAMKLAKQYEDCADSLVPSLKNSAAFDRLMARAKALHSIANNIASTYLKSRKTSN